MKKTISLLCAMSTMFLAVLAQEVNFAVHYQNGSHVVYQGSDMIATTNVGQSELLQTLEVSRNSSPVFNEDSVEVDGVLIPLPKPFDELVVSVSDTSVIAMSRTLDSAWFYSWVNEQWVAEFAPLPPNLIGIEHSYIGDRLFIVALFQNGNDFSSGIACANCSPLTGESVLLGDSVEEVFILRDYVQYEITETNISCGTVTIPFIADDNVEQSVQSVCAGDWCLYGSRVNVYGEQMMDYISTPYKIGLEDTTNNPYLWHFFEPKAIGMPSVSGNFSVSLDCPGMPGVGNESIFRTNQYFSFVKKGEGVDLNGKENRFFLRRMTFPGWGQPGFLFEFDLGKTYYENNEFVSIDDRGDWNQNQMCVYDSLGNFIRKYRATDTHDGMFLDQYSVEFGMYSDSTGYYLPPVVRNNNGMGEYIPAIPHEFIPMIGDSCNMAASGPVFGPMDTHHGNSVQMFFVPALQQYVVLQSARNIAKWPISYPLCAWRFDPVAKVLTLDHQLNILMNSSSFGYGRDGGHDLQVETEFQAGDSWIISQFENVVCDDPETDPSYGHTARLTFSSSNGWEMSDFKVFIGSPSVAMGNIDVYLAQEDTFTVVNSGTSVGTWEKGWDSKPQVYVRNYETEKPVGMICFGKSKTESAAIAYQCNASTESFIKPAFAVNVIEVGDSLVITTDTLPGTGEWFWWLGNKPANQPIKILKQALHENEGVPVYVSGWFSNGDTIPNLPNDAPRNRWLSDPVWVPYVSGVGLEEIVDRNTINIYPNPSSDFFQISGVKEKEIKDMKIVDITGKEYFTVHTDNKVFIGDLSPGVYFLKIFLNNYEVVKKVVKM